MTVNFPSYGTTIGALGRYDNWNTLSAEYGKQVVHYEQNHQIDAPSAAWATGGPINDATYGGPAGKINQFLLAFLNSAQYEQVVSGYLRAFGALSNSLSTSIFGMTTTNPWLTHPRQNPMAETSLGGTTTKPGYANWRVHELANNGKRRLVIQT